MKDFVILQECRFEEGICYKLSELKERIRVTEQRLKNLGIFSEVDIDFNIDESEKTPYATTVIKKIEDRWIFFRFRSNTLIIKSAISSVQHSGFQFVWTRPVSPSKGSVQSIPKIDISHVALSEDIRRF